MPLPSSALPAGGSPPRHTGTIVVLSLAALLLHLAVNLLGGYGYFRDELYYLACSSHLAAGYVDQPPLSIILLAASRSLIGDSLFALRLLPALAAALSVAVLCRLVRRMGGGITAMTLAALAYLAAPQLLGFGGYYSMNGFDVLLWLLAADLLVGVVEAPGTGRWAALGAVVGLALLNKISALWLGAGIAVGVVLTPLRSSLRRPGPYLAALIALALFSPFVIWNLTHDFAHLEFMRNAVAGKYASLTRARFLHDTFLAMDPVTALVWLPGLAFYLFDRAGRRYRAVGLVFLTTLAVLLANPHTKAEYIGAAFPLLFAGGGVLVERVAAGRGRALGWGLAGLLAASGVALAPFALPVLPVARYLAYARALGVAPSTPEGKPLAELPQFFADMHGWRELAQDVSRVYLSLPEAERATTVALVGNYGEAGALEHYARELPLPRVICTHNSYWLWGVGDTRITTFIRLGGTREDYLDNYAEVVPAGVHTCTGCMPYENHLAIFVVRGRRTPIQDAWPEYKHYE